MYEQYFHLHRLPFRMNPDPSALFMTHSHREAFAVLLYAVAQRKGLVVLTGSAGTGKSSLVRALMQSVADVRFSLLLMPSVATDEFLDLVLLDLGETDLPSNKAQKIHRLYGRLLEIRSQGKIAVLVVDEAHTLTPSTLEEIRLLSNFETSQEKLLQIILVGQSDLVATLNRPDVCQLQQRIEMWADLKVLDAGVVAQYIEHRWLLAGGRLPLPFTPEAVAVIAKASKGFPRRVNCICDNALLLAYAEERQCIGQREVEAVLREIDHKTDEASKDSRRRVAQRVSGRTAAEDSAEHRSGVSWLSVHRTGHDAAVADSSRGSQPAGMSKALEE